MRNALKIALTICVFILFAGCHSKQENVVRVNIRGEPHTLDPRKARDLGAMILTKMFFEGLTRLNPDEKVELALAENVDISSDGKVYTFTLRKADWSSGDPVTAQDFVHAWKKVLNPLFPADQAFQLYVLKNGKAAKEGKVAVDDIGVTALSENQLQVELQYPIPYFLELVSLPVFFPVSQAVDQHQLHWAEDSSTLVSNGPFKIKEWKHNDYLHVVKNAAYWDAAHVKLKEIKLMMVPEDTEMKMFEKGELDWAGSPLSILPVESLARLKEKGLLNIKPFLATYFFRTNVESEPFQHPLMRQAFAFALKRSDIVKHVTQGEQLPATGLLPPSLRINPEPYFIDGDKEKARETFELALKATGLTRETFPPISLLYRAGERNHLIAQTVQEQWRDAFGIVVQLQAVEGKIYFDRISKKNFQLAASSWTADFNDPINFLEVFKFKAGGSNNTAWENPRYRELLDQILEVKDADERHKLLAECESILMAEMPIIPLFHYTMLYVTHPHIKNIAVSSLGTLDFKWAYVEEGKR